MSSPNDKNSEQVFGAHRRPYDPRPAIGQLVRSGDNDELWRELFQELHHQGAVDTASYAAVVELARAKQERPRLGWKLYSLVAVVEVERHRRGNPPIPVSLRESYDVALQNLGTFALRDLGITRDPLMTRCALAIVALSKGLLKWGAILSGTDESEVDEWLEEKCNWSSTYRDEDAG